MYQIDNDSVAASLPASTSAGIPGYFTDGNPATGLAATVLPAEFMNMIMLELCNLATAGGQTLDKDNHSQLVLAVENMIATLATVTWDNVTQRPTNFVTTGSNPALTGLELVDAAPNLDFHFGSDSADYNVRVSNYADGGLQIANKAGALMQVGSAGVIAAALLIAKKALSIPSQGAAGALMFNSSDNALSRFGFNHTDTALNLATYTDAGALSQSAIAIARATGKATFAARPIFGTATPWDSENFDPTTKATKATTLAGYGITDAAPKATTLAGYGITDAIPASQITTSASAPASTDGVVGSIWLQYGDA